MWSSRADRAATPAAAPYRTASHRARRPFPSPTQPSDPTVSTHSLALISLALIVRASGSLKAGRIVASVRKIQDAVPTPAQTPVTDSTVGGSGGAAAAGFRDHRCAGPRRLTPVLRGRLGLGADPGPARGRLPAGRPRPAAGAVAGRGHGGGRERRRRRESRRARLRRAVHAGAQRRQRARC